MGKELILLKDGTHGTHQDSNVGPYLLSAKNIKNGQIKIDKTDRKISKNEYDKIHKNFHLQKDDVLLTIVGSIGESAVLRDPTNLTFQRSVAYLRPKSMNSYYLQTLMTTSLFQNNLKKYQVVSAQPGIYLGDLSKISIMIAKDIQEQFKISDVLKKLNNLIALHQRKYTLRFHRQFIPP